MTSQPMTDTTALSVEELEAFYATWEGMPAGNVGERIKATIAQSAAREAVIIEALLKHKDALPFPVEDVLGNLDAAAKALLTRLESAEGERDALRQEVLAQKLVAHAHKVAHGNANKRAESAEREVARLRGMK